MNQRELDKLRHDTPPEFQEIIGDDFEALDIDTESIANPVGDFFQRIESEEVVKATPLAPDNDYLFQGNLTKILTDEAPQSEFLKMLPGFPIPPPVPAGASLSSGLPVGQPVNLCRGEEEVDGEKRLCGLMEGHDGPCLFIRDAKEAPTGRKSAEFNRNIDRFIKSSRWLRDRLNSNCTDEDRRQGAVQKLWRETFGFSSDALDDPLEAREAVTQLVRNLTVGLMENGLALS